MDFALSPELEELAAEAEAVALEAAKRSSFPEDSWIVGYDPELTRDLGRRGWIGMTWPVPMRAVTGAASWSVSSSTSS